MAKEKPVHEIKLASVKAAIWQNQLESGRTMYSVTFSRLYKEEGAWRDASSFGRNELPLVARVADMSLDWILEQKSSDQMQPADE
jgi:hypothetical protein